jgi:glycosyltransferase involved in cell wall biosynthesis
MSEVVVATAFWLAAGLAVYPWIVYPLLLGALAARRRHPTARPAPWPFLSVIVAAYNEAGCIQAKLASALGHGYLSDRIEVIVVSDGSTDETDRLVASYPDPRVKLIRQEPRAGKSPALNRAVGYARGDVLVFTDANALFAEDALRRLAAPFADPKVGLVSGQGLYAAPGGRDAQAVGNGYVRFEAFLRSRETALDVLGGADGAIYALRRTIYRELRPAEVNDLAHAIQTTVAGYVARFDPGAYTIEPPSAHAGQEFRRHVRIVAQNAQLLADWLPRVVAARRWRLWWVLVSHRILRWTTAPMLALALAGNIALLGTHPLYVLTLAAQSAFYVLSLVGLAAERAGLRLGRAALPYYFCVVSAAGIAGLARYLRGGAQAVWAPAGQASPTRRAPERAA